LNFGWILQQVLYQRHRIDIEIFDQSRQATQLLLTSTMLPTPFWLPASDEASLQLTTATLLRVIPSVKYVQ
jgi:hypothetical protein